MIRRLLLLGLIAVVAYLWIRRVLGRARKRRTAEPPAVETLVRDEVCHAFVSPSRAVRARVGSEEHFFCSPRCRDAFLAGRAIDPP